MRAILMALGKHDLSPILPFRIVGGMVDSDQIPRLLLEFGPEVVGTVIAISGSMGVISEISSIFTGLDRCVFRSLADIRSSMVLKLMHLWKSHVVTSRGRPEICFIDFVVKFTAVLPIFALAAGRTDPGSTSGGSGLLLIQPLQIGTRNHSAAKQIQGCEQ